MATSSEGSAERPLPLILDGSYFKISKKSANDNVVALCLTCKKEVKGGLTSTGNFVIHLKKHAETFSEYEEKKRNEGSALRKRIAEFTKQSKAKMAKSTGQQTLASFGVRRDEQGNALDVAILKLITKQSLPLSLVDYPEFRELLTVAQRMTATPSSMSRRRLCRMLESENIGLINEIKLDLKRAEHLCLTMDIWTCRGMSRAFFGVTVHWITENLSRISRALACRRFEGAHTHDKIIEKFWEIMQQFEIQPSKVTKVVTDNGSNFTKAFKDLHREPGIEQDLEEADEIIFENVGNRLLEQDTIDDVEYIMPSHQRCAAHTLSLICVTDIKLFKSKHQTKSFAKCQAVWNKTSRSTRSAEQSYEICGRKLVKPVPTRWNSLFDSVECLLQLKEVLRPLFEKLTVDPLTDAEISFLDEYFKCVKPIANALHRLQGDNVFYGELIPVLLQVKKELMEIKNGQSALQYCKNLPDILLQGLAKRFDTYMNLSSDHNDAILASISHPFFKLRWIHVDKRNELRQLFVNEACRLATTNSSIPEIPQSARGKDDDYFNFEVSDDTNEISLIEQQQAATTAECHTYFQTQDRELSSLNNFPTVKTLFKKFNTALPSSAPVERLFSFAGLILTPNRQRMNDELFETLVLRKANKY